jgi:hypothetical protein
MSDFSFNVFRGWFFSTVLKAVDNKENAVKHGMRIFW